MVRNVLSALVLCTAIQAVGAPGVRGGEAVVQVSARESFSLPVRTLQEMRIEAAFARTVHQQYDFSCGSAALATLLTYQYGRPTSEMAVFRAMYAVGNQAQIRAKGFSLLDMKRYLQSLDYTADGVRVSLNTLIKVGVPAIALITDHGYRHFVVVKGADATQVVIGDPALGRRVLSRRAFDAARVGNLFFVIRSDLHGAQFNLPADWDSPTAPPLGTAVNRSSLAELFLKIPNDSVF
jgi:predicted double-glycine peptidase